MKQKKTVTTEYDMVRVRWEDTTTTRGWNNVDGGFDTGWCDTLGYMVENNKDKVILAPCLTDTCLGADVWAIPQGIVKEIVRLNDGKKVKKAV